MRVMVTGAFGFIGSYIAEHMHRLGHELVIVDRLSYAGKIRNLNPDVLAAAEVFIADLGCSELMERMGRMKPPDYIVHACSETHVDRAISDPVSFQMSNTVGTTRFLEAVYRLGWKPLKITIHSTDEVFGSTPPGVMFDENAPMNPSNAYAASKVAMEAIARSYFNTHGMPVVVIRPCNTFAARQHPEKVIPKFVRQMLSGQPVTLYNDGRGSRDWLHVHDHARAVALLMEKGEPGTSYNLAADEEHTDADIAERIAMALTARDGAEVVWPQITYVPGRPGHDRRYFMDGTRLRALGWQPIVPFEDGFRETVLWNAQNRGYWDSDVVRLSAATATAGITTQSGANTVQMATVVG